MLGKMVSDLMIKPGKSPVFEREFRLHTTDLERFFRTPF